MWFDPGKCLLAWDPVQRPKKLDGLGIWDLKRMTLALRLRWLWLQPTEASRPWASLPIKEDKLTFAHFKASIQCIVSNGRSTFFWTDPWIQGRSVELLAPDLFACPMGTNWWQRTVVDALAGNSWLTDISGPLTVPVIIQNIHLHEWVQALQLNEDVEDSLVWRWSSNDNYSSRSAYEALFVGQSATLGAKEIRKVRALNNCKLFFWQVMHERVWMFERLQNHAWTTTVHAVSTPRRCKA
jgi:hypothetical protein